MNQEMITAILRAAYGGVLSGAIVGLGTYQSTNDVRSSAIAGGLALLMYLGARGGVEGVVDSNRAKAAAAANLSSPANEAKPLP